MLKSFKTSVSLVLIIGLLFTCAAYAADIPNATATDTTAPTVLMKVTGTVSQASNTAGYILTAEDSTVYSLTGKTEGLEKYLDEKVIVEGYVLNNTPGLMFPVAAIVTFYVVRYTPVMPVPTPTPTVKLAGILSLSGNATYKYALTTEANIKYLLTGKTDGIDAYLDQKIIVVGYQLPTPATDNDTSVIGAQRIFYVVEFGPAPTPIPTPTPTITPSPTPTVELTGLLSLSGSSIYKYVLTTEANIKYLLTGKIDGIDTYLNQRIIVVGYPLENAAADNSVSVIGTDHAFYVVEFKPAPTPSPTVTPSPTPTVKLTGLLSPSGNTIYKYELTTEANIKYLLTGKIDGIDAYLNQRIIVVGYPLPALAADNSASVIGADRVFYVVEFKPAPTEKLTGLLSLSDNTLYKYTLTTEANIKYLLTGNTDGMENYIGQKIIVIGYPQKNAVPVEDASGIAERVLVVVEFFPAPTPTGTIKLAGTLSLTDNTIYKYALTTESKKKFLLTGNTDGMENYIGQKMILVGYLEPVMDAFGTKAIAVNRSVFVVVEYYPMPVEGPKPIATALPLAETVSIVAADDTNNTIIGLDPETMEYAISTDNGSTYGEYTSAPSPFLGGNKMVKVRIKAQDGIKADADTILTFTANPGDVNGDGYIDIADVVRASEIAVGDSDCTTQEIARASVSNPMDLNVTIGDVILIAESAVSGTASFPANQQ